MKLIKPSVEYIPQEDICKHIELCARTCYKSENKITDDSAHKFVEGLINARHLAMLEHGTVYAKCGPQQYLEMGDGSFDSDKDFWAVANSPYSKLYYDKETDCNYVTTNYRVLFDLMLEDSGFSFDEFIAFFQCEPTEYHKKRYTVKFICDRGVSHELVRHRVFSFAQESQRYCNYSKDKFGNEVTFINNPDGQQFTETYWLMDAYEHAEKVYFKLLKEGYSPQQARRVLPNATKTEIIMTGFEDDWKHFFDLRLRGTTGKPHPDMLVVAQLAWNEFKDKLNLEL